MITPQAISNHVGTFDRCWEKVKDLPGDIAEFGCFNGGSALQLTKYGRMVWAFDTFEGIPKEDYQETLDSQNPPGKFRPDYNILEWMSTQPLIKPIKGRYAETLGTINSDIKFCMVFVDCDLYESHKQVLAWLEQHLVPGAAIIYDDYYGLPGAKKAVDEWGYHVDSNQVTWWKLKEVLTPPIKVVAPIVVSQEPLYSHNKMPGLGLHRV